ncbi:pyruvate dehydrogenase E1 component alpha subunit [Desulfacinum infernum DSM 9756]|jgi:pyruvate dehydrogenase E1 component alpha subunit|uniref:Pyruvate dehydrogenase E1 component subunit alpha n=1 Tax=Desulfacinum infernum DSM 9756 TaxID=1121391 RepID=A0A1M4TE29_9BACT|nr:pyruvate dehydrogenase (acetyl-transferring) E1 component subunit alpha [Desulfacinum infernum]MBC7360410.1 pyruvate dehydrogenase (acetyl-transferring) E1 component subunit alpha [Desulfacinum sp.]SHE42799.1 pyruvate dehydrogenase E1 component alpha subunit [Desulfacinum infernum DSM 9756]
MPRVPIEITSPVEYLSILKEDGTLDKALEPEIPEDLLLRLYRTMVLGRLLDERMLQLQRQGRIGTFAPIKGQEAAQLGAVAALDPGDWVVPCFRETAAQLWRGTPMENILLYFGGYEEGGRIPDDQKTLPVAIPVASQLLHAVGLGWAARYRKTGEVAMTFFGDGATSEGDFHEALNCAAVFQTPTVFVCQNNQWAISVPLSRQTRSKTLAQKAVAYEMPGIRVDGNDVLAVYAAAREAVERARAGEGPTFLECVTYRLAMHTTADDPTKYRSEEEVALWAQKDPIPRFQKYLLEKGILTQEKVEENAAWAGEAIGKAVDRYEAMRGELGDPLEMFEHHFETLPPTLQEQREELKRTLEAERMESHDA